MFQRFTVIVNNMRANVVVLPYDDHDRAIKPLHSLDRTVWSEEVEAILESEKYETLMVFELFSKLKSSEVDHGVRARIENPTDPIVRLSFPDQGLMLTHPPGCTPCLLLCPFQMRILTCLVRMT
jgi:hypothetical protein